MVNKNIDYKEVSDKDMSDKLSSHNDDCFFYFHKNIYNSLMMLFKTSIFIHIRYTKSVIKIREGITICQKEINALHVEDSLK